MPFAVVMFPGTTLSLNDDGIVNLRLNVSDSSARVSMVTGMLIVVSVDPAVKVASIGVEV